MRQIGARGYLNRQQTCHETTVGTGLAFFDDSIGSGINLANWNLVLDSEEQAVVYTSWDLNTKVGSDTKLSSYLT